MEGLNKIFIQQLVEICRSTEIRIQILSTLSKACRIATVIELIMSNIRCEVTTGNRTTGTATGLT